MTTGERDSSGTDLRILARRFGRPAVAADDEVRPNGALGPPIVLKAPPSRRAHRRASRIGGAIALGLLAAGGIALAAVRGGTDRVPLSQDILTKAERSPRAVEPAVVVREPEPVAQPAVVRPSEPVLAAAPRARVATAPPPIRSSPSASPTRAPRASNLSQSTDALLESALAGTTADPIAVSLPEVPTRGQVSTRLRALEGEVAACGTPSAEPRAIEARLVVDGPTGSVRSAAVHGADAQTASCVERVLRSTTFPRFARERFTIVFPYRLPADQP